MKTLTKRDVGQRPALLWRAAEQCAETGDAVWVLDRGEPTYRVEYAPRAFDPLDALERQGVLQRRCAHPATPPPLETTYQTEQVAAILGDLRRDR